MIPRRVKNKFDGSFGWAVEQFGRGRYRIDWDRPTPHQNDARPHVPGKVVEWAEESTVNPSKD